MIVNTKWGCSQQEMSDLEQSLVLENRRNIGSETHFLQFLAGGFVYQTSLVYGLLQNKKKETPMGPLDIHARYNELNADHTGWMEKLGGAAPPTTH